MHAGGAGGDEIEIVVGRKREVTFPATHVSDFNRAVGGQICFGGKMTEDLDKFMNLPVFVREAFAHRALRVGDAEFFQPRLALRRK